MLTYQQIYADTIYQLVKEVGERHKKGTPARAQYGALAQQLPVLAHTAGLYQALKYMQRKAGEEIHDQNMYHLLLTQLAQVVAGVAPDDFIQQCQLTDLADTPAWFQRYKVLTHKSMLALKWFKRFAQSILEVDITEAV